MIKVGIIGCGAIGSRLALEIDKNLNKQFKLVALCDKDKARIDSLRKRLRIQPKATDINALIKKSSLIIEAANPKTAGEALTKCLKAKKDILIMSAGALADKERFLKKAKSNIYVPSGAIAGLDALKAARIAGIQKVTLTTSKGSASIETKRKTKGVIFYGSVKEAVKKFPKNINVSSILALCVGEKKVKVKIVFDPKLKRNQHHILAEGKFGTIETTTMNLPCPDNKKTSYLAVLSAISTLKQLSSPLKVG